MKKLFLTFLSIFMIFTIFGCSNRVEKPAYKEEWVQNGTKWVYYDATGDMCKSEWINDNENWYYVGNDGAMQRSRWIEDKFYVDQDGKMLTNIQKNIDGVMFKFDSKGIAERVKNVWEKTHYVDDFGDFTDEAYIRNESTFNGLFSNSATTNSKCGFKFLIDNENVALMIYEYGSHQVKGREDEYRISMKTNDGYTTNFTGYINGDRMYFDNTGKNAIINCLKNGVDFKLRIDEVTKYGTPSSYLFEVESGNFSSLWWN